MAVAQALVSSAKTKNFAASLRKRSYGSANGMPKSGLRQQRPGWVCLARRQLLTCALHVRKDFQYNDGSNNVSRLQSRQAATSKTYKQPFPVNTGSRHCHGILGRSVPKHRTLAAKMIMLSRVTPNLQAMMRQAATVRSA